MNRRRILTVMVLSCMIVITGCSKAEYSVIDENERKTVAGKASTVITDRMIRDGLYDIPASPDGPQTLDVPEISDDDRTTAGNRSADDAMGSDIAASISGYLDMLGNASINSFTGEFTFPENSSIYSGELASQIISINSGYDRESTIGLFNGAGFEIVGEAHYDKSMSDASHNCAYMIGKKRIEYRGTQRTLFLTMIRGTNGGEWYSNFDVVASRTENPQCAENFLMCAEDVFRGLEAVTDGTEDPVILITGHSRGAAAANLLGVLANAKYGLEDVYTYTFAAPATITGEFPSSDQSNIFNIINRSDVVPMMPLSEWGFRRAGSDIMVTSDEDSVGRVAIATAELVKLAPDVASYYGNRHSLSKAGLGSDGLTAYEFMSIFAQYLAGNMQPDSAGAASFTSMAELIAPESDFAPLMGLIGNLMRGQSKVLFAHMISAYGQAMTDMP